MCYLTVVFIAYVTCEVCEVFSYTDRNTSKSPYARTEVAAVAYLANDLKPSEFRTNVVLKKEIPLFE